MFLNVGEWREQERLMKKVKAVGRHRCTQHELLGDGIEDAEGQCDERRTLNAQEGRNMFQVWQLYISIHS
jgi:hypothetical protein